MASLYGKGLWGVGFYSQSQSQALAGDLRPIVTFAADLDLKGSVDLAGALTPVVAFGGNLQVVRALAGSLTPQVTFGGALTATVGLAGGLVPAVTFGGALGVTTLVEGEIDINVIFSTPPLTSGPLWTPTAPCAPADWEPAELCHG